MKAIAQDTYGPADVLELRDVDVPSVGDDEVLVRVHAAGVDIGVWIMMTGLPYAVRPIFGMRAPKARIRGRDVAGTVESVGADVTRFKPGDEVFGVGEGTFAEYVSVPEDKLMPKPANLSFEQAAVTPVSGLTALGAVRDVGRVQPGQRVLVIGASGGVGTFAVQLAKSFGAKVTGVCSTSKVDLVRSLGADDVIDYTTDKLTGTYDLIVDTAGHRPLRLLRRLLTPRGTLVLVGSSVKGRRWSTGMGRGFHAVLLSRFVRQRMPWFISRETNAGLADIAKLAEAGAYTPVIDRTFALCEAADAVRYVAEGHTAGKTVVTV
jgi:NADPH:quinone reductase-like Zn-dependent oxidoreductase